MNAVIQESARVLVVDDTEEDQRLLSRLLSAEGYAVKTAGDGIECLAAVQDFRPDVVLLDVLMPRLNGFETCRRLKGDPATRLIPIVLVTTLDEREDKIQGLNAGADDFMSKPVNAHELRARLRSLVRLKRFTDDLDSAEAVILSIALTIEARDSSTTGHCERVAAYATALGVQLDLPGEDLTALHRGGYLHDIGKIAVPDAILLNQGRLTAAELVILRQHPVVGAQLCGELRTLRTVRPIVRSHHERVDGSGYPDGLKGDAIPLLAQVLSIADAFDAMTTARPYRGAMTAAAAVDALRDEAARGWRRGDLVAEFIGLADHGRLARLAAVDLEHSPVRPLAGVR